MDPNNRAQQPSSETHICLSSAYRYLVCERKRYKTKTASYHSMSAALYCLDRLINKYWPGAKSHKELFSYMEYDSTNYLHLWYTYMTKACDRPLNSHPNMISVIVFIRDMVITIPADKKKLESKKNCSCMHKPKPEDQGFNTLNNKGCWVECILERLETAKWYAKAESKRLMMSTGDNRKIKDYDEYIHNVMVRISNYHNIKMKHYSFEENTLSDVSRFSSEPGIRCVNTLNDVLTEVRNLKSLIGKEDLDKWIPPECVDGITQLVKDLTSIYYK